MYLYTPSLQVDTLDFRRQKNVALSWDMQPRYDGLKRKVYPDF